MNPKDLIAKNKTVEPEAAERAYGYLVEKEFRKKYSQSQVEAIVNNYLLDPTNESYKAEMDKMQAYRIECKNKYKTK